MTSAERADAELVQAARSGDVSALGAVLERHRAAMYAVALSLLRDPTEAHDAVQDAFVIALARLGELRDPNAVAAWLRTVVRNAALMRLRSRRAAPADPSEFEDRGHEHVEQVIDRLALADWIWTAIDRLPADQAVAVMLRYFSRHASYKAIARVLGVPIGTVRSRLSQARERLADDLLRTAARATTDHRALVDERARWWRAAADELYRDGTGTLYAAQCAPGLLVEEPATGYRVNGIEDHRRGVEKSVAAGVRLHLTDIWASTGVTIVEGTYVNPPDDPRHCPATHTEVRVQRHGLTRRLTLYYRPHDPAIA